MMTTSAEETNPTVYRTRRLLRLDEFNAEGALDGDRTGRPLVLRARDVMDDDRFGMAPVPAAMLLGIAMAIRLLRAEKRGVRQPYA